MDRTGSLQERIIGDYRGFDIGATYTDRGYQLSVWNPETDVKYRTSHLEKTDLNPTGLATRVDNLVKGVPKSLSPDAIQSHGRGNFARNLPGASRQDL